VDDAVDATAQVASTEGCANQVVHVGNPLEETEITDLAKLMMKLTDTDAAIELCDGKDGSVARRCPDISKLQALTGFTPCTPLHAGLGRTIDWYMAQA
jgi:UDP-glucose 4-epimerase/UDP-glucuronate decarboxylase